MTIVGARIDGRLIHGQVANLWTTKLNISRIMVIDDEVAENAIEKSGLKLATPAGVKWLAAGLTLAGRMLPGLGFAILLRYLPVKRNLHYLALGFGLTAMLTVLYSNIQTLGGAVSSIVGTLPKDAAVTFANNFKGLSMIGVAIFGIFLAVQHFKYSQRTVVAAPAASTNSESEEIEDDEL